MALEVETFLIHSTDNSAVLSINPRDKDGVGSANNQWSTPLVLFGHGAAFWGEQFNENFYRSLEHLACAEKSGVVPITPEDEGDIAPGHGINSPLPGQTWFNTTRNALFVYSAIDGSSPVEYHWTPFTSIALQFTSTDLALLTDNRTGDLAINTDLNTINVWQDTSWVEVGTWAPPSSTIPNVLDDLADVNTAGKVNGSVLKLSGSIWQDGTDELGTPGGPGGGGTVYDVTGIGSVSGNVSISGSFTLVSDSASPGVSLYYGTNASGSKGFFAVPVLDGGVPSTPGITDHGGASGLLDDDHPVYVNVSGDSMSGTLNMGTHYVTNVINPVNPQDLATKAYVNSVIVPSVGFNLIASGSAAHNTTIPYPYGYNSGNTTMIVSLHGFGAGGGSGYDQLYIGASASPFGWLANAQFSVENAGSLRPATLNYWMYAAGPPAFPETGLVNINDYNIISWNYGANAVYTMDPDGVAYDQDNIAIPGQWKLAGASSDYDVYATYISGNFQNASFDGWLNLGTIHSWILDPPAIWGTFYGAIQIAIRKVSTGAILDTAVITFQAEGRGSGNIP